MSISQDQVARRAAKRVGLKAIKSRQRTHVPNLDNFGEFMLIDPMKNVVVAGEKFDLSAEDVIDWCTNVGHPKELTLESIYPPVQELEPTEPAREIESTEPPLMLTIEPVASVRTLQRER